MGLFKRLAGLLGFGRDEEQHHHQEDAAAEAAIPASSSGPDAAAASAPAQHLPRKGFSVPVQVPVERAPPPPLLVFCPAGDGGLQLKFSDIKYLNVEHKFLVSDLVRMIGSIESQKGLRWYARRLRIDEDGDVADEFLDEVLPNMSMSTEEHNRPLPRFEVKYSTRPAKVKNLALLPNGKIQHLVEHQGRLEWV
ncbi:hypothetical protein Sango_2156600 [Sesamum angolense]|uniref:Uncharacterized protein n=1 Tax=Sesamum angolense TaxID=2727404 RepID=A0AAE2BMN1_9LAMI|nr:hypothetical protein Sango_2156600 [Sesamum angolense]